MPSTATITAFYTFTAGTKARAAQVNANFDNLRGHLIPINTDTVSSSNQTHDLGSSDHQWRRLYVKEPVYVNGSQAGKVYIQSVYDGSTPTDIIADQSWLNKIAFKADETTGVGFQFVVPDEYVVGNRMSISLRGYVETNASSHVVMECVSALFKPNSSDASLTVPANVLTSSSNILPTTTGLMFTDTSLRITGATGLINSLTVTAGDVIAVNLYRKGNNTSDTNTGYFYVSHIFIDLNN